MVQYIPLHRCAVSVLVLIAASSSVASAFQSSSPMHFFHAHDVSSSSSSSSKTQRDVSLKAQYYPPFSDPYFNPYFPPTNNNAPYITVPNPSYFHNNRPPPPYRSGPYRATVASRNSVEEEPDYISEADVILDMQQDEGGEWISDQERAVNKRKHGEVINFDPEEQVPRSKPLKNAAATPSDLYEDENKFQGRRPGQPVNRDSNTSNDRQQQNRRGGPKATIVDEEDPRAQHVVMDEYDNYLNDFFEFPVPPQQRPPPMPRRPGPTVYTPEEEDLIAAMGGRGPPGQQHISTQEFAGLGTMKNNRVGRGLTQDPQQLNYNPEQNYNPEMLAANTNNMMSPVAPSMQMPPPDMMQQQFREEGFLGDSTLKEISLDYSVPIPYLADALANWGVPVPINPDLRLGDMVTGEQAFAILEAIHTLDIASLHEQYSEESLMNICDYYDIDIKVAFDFCMDRGWALPFGVRTFLRVEQEDEMLNALA